MLSQFGTVLLKNLLLNWRSKDFLRESISPIILGIFIVVSERNIPNFFTTPFYLCISIFSLSRFIGMGWVNERETQQKQLQKIMGLTQESYVCAWLIYFVMNCVLTSLLIMGIVGLFAVTPSTNFAPGYSFMHLAMLYFLFSLANLGFVMLISCFFKTAKVANQALIFIQLVVNFLYFLRFSDDVTHSSFSTLLLALLPQMSFMMGITSIAFIQAGYPLFHFTYSESIIYLSCQAVCLILLALYLQEVLPNGEGTQKHPLFFLRQTGRNIRNIEPRLLQESDLPHTSAKYEQPNKVNVPPIARLMDVSRSFGDKCAVDGFTLSFYPSEIFCLLGHNGAGKSTIINMLTGLLSPTTGCLSVLGMNYRENSSEIRKHVGLCLQYNVLYDSLTVEDHLRYYYRLKNADPSNIEREVGRIVEQCNLIDEKKKPAKNLSGGNKRKLCLGNALIGGSKIVFLDQPSSGLDPNSRHSIWGILKDATQCTIVLTTHHLEEAEYLSHRIAVMSEGRLVIVGDCNYIKDKFSVGYHLMTKQGCDVIVKKHIPTAIVDEQSPINTMKFILPLNELPKYSGMLRQLESVSDVSICVSNLEDAFLKLGRENEVSPEDTQELVLPDVISTYTFHSQFKAIMLKKYRTTLRSLSTLVSVVLPLMFIILGVVVTCLIIPGRVEVEIKTIVFSLFLTWAFVFNTSLFCGSLVLERENKFKYISNVMGLRKLPYWTANYTFDLLIFLAPLLVYFILIYSLGDKTAVLTGFTGEFIPLLLLFATSFIGYCYLFSFIFHKANSAYRLFPFINLIFFSIIPQLIIALTPNSVLATYVLPFFSPFVAFSNFFYTPQIVPRGVQVLWVSYTALAAQSVLYLLATLYLENLRFTLRKQPINQQGVQHHQEGGQQNQGNPQEQAIDTETGLRAIHNSPQKCPIYVNELTKEYPNGYRAISDNSFAVPKAHIFGLLGPNGAGKSTTFNIITAAIPRSSGQVKLFQQQVNKGVMEIFSKVGVCPQYNPLYQNLTVQQHLQYFALLKGVPQCKIKELVQFYANLLSLGPYLRVKAGVLSGGNKRKMCVGMTMIGNPEVMFFDEPSAGVDPVSRRCLWRCLAASARVKQTSMVLTTHSMNEAQSLCSQIGILIKGKFVCMDTPRNLKETYGKGYRVNVVAEVQHQEDIIKTMRDTFEVEIQRIETKPDELVFVLKNERIQLWKVFQMFERTLLGKLIRYEVKESSLEEVFIHLSKLQPHEEEKEYAEPWQLLCWEWGASSCTLIS